ncbi:MAG: GspE/PulE family protein [Planctomycetota bacterium]|jgi:type IV pilus assembly protein PilB
MKLSQNNITSAVTPKSKNDEIFGESLITHGYLRPREVLEAVKEQQFHGGRLGDVLVKLKMLSEVDLARALAEYCSLEYFSLCDQDKISTKVARMLPESIAKRFCLLAIGEIDNKIIISMADPLDVIALDTITHKTKRQIKVVVSSSKEIKRAIEMVYHGSDIEEQHLRDLVELECQEDKDNVTDAGMTDMDEDEFTSEKAAAKAPVIRFVDLLLSQAVKCRASDVHIEPQEKTMIIRMRVDGVLCDMVPPAKKMQAAVITRIKILCEMDIAERRLPQDGRFKIPATGRNIDVRVSALPTIYGEKIVMRILDKHAVNHDLNQLGFESELLNQFKTILTQPHGIIIVTGPTGSGKSTTLYSALNYLKDPTKNITTVENPVEYRLPGINQVQVKPEIDFTFASCLRAILRQDPDIILIGEIRDKETVEIAIKASLTGHLVLSTFHTNDAPSAITRLAYMGIEPYLLASSLNLIIAQRLVRKICDKCKKPITLSNELLKRLKISPEQAKDSVFYHGEGCKSCGETGYLGRLPIFEFLPVDNDIRDKITAEKNESQIREMARNKGYGGLLESGLCNILSGLTTAEEVLSVAFSDVT